MIETIGKEMREAADRVAKATRDRHRHFQMVTPQEREKLIREWADKLASDVQGATD